MQTFAMTEPWTIRTARPDDHRAIVEVVDDWWGWPVATMLPRLFFDHFCDTSLVAESSDGLAGFLIGFMSSARADEAYVHFIGVNPALRTSGLGRELYRRFIESAAARDRRVVRAITSPQNERSIAFHRRIGFDVSDPVPDYDRAGAARVMFTLHIAPNR